MRPQEGGLILADFFGRSPRDSSSHQRKPTPGSAFGNSRNSPSSGSVNLTDREEGRLDALEEALRFAVAVLPVLVHPSVPSVLPEAEVHLAQSTRSQLSLCTVNTTERNFANNPYPSGISGELDFSSSLLAARGERDAGEPRCAWETKTSSSIVLYIKLVRRSVCWLLISSCCLLFCLDGGLVPELRQVG